MGVACFAHVSAQCINTFPYNEDFEAGPAGWTTGGTGNDWALGTPTKATINSAASGNNCWITGNLAGNSYNLGERSFLLSPCFDFSTLQYPYISFFIYWESESQYDGAALQYSTDGGATWGPIGYAGRPVNCMNQNWYNTASIPNLNGLATLSDGWTGTTKNTQGSCQGGGGSGGWVTAMQCMLGLKGTNNVRLRFIFGAGTACNNYDGIAFDNITIGEAPPNQIDFTYTCNGNTVNFTNSLLSSCPDTLRWTFSDGSTATGLNTTHTFPGPGTYTATLYAGGPCNPSTTVSKQLQIISTSLTTQNATCAGYTDGSASVTVTPAGAYNYTWSTTPVQTTATATNLAAGDYAVTVSSALACPTILQASIGEPLGLGRTLSSKPDTCAGAGGTANIDVTGGTPPYTYAWSNGAGNTDSLSNLNTGNYIVTITDFDGCSVSDTFSIGYLQGLAVNFTEVKNVSCYDDRNGAITATTIGNGALPYIYQWNNLANTASINKLDTGTYTLTVSDANGCTVEDSAVIAKEVCTSYVFFPTGFTPNGDGINDRFKPKYSEDLSQYTIRVYNRWGELVYQSNDINEGWNGYYKGLLQPLGVYVFVSEYRFGQEKILQASGNLTLLK